MHDLISFTKSITEDTIQYMRKFFEQNFAIYSILSVYEDYNISIENPDTDSGDIIYRIESAQNNNLEDFIVRLNGSMVTAYGITYIINVDKPIDNILDIHLTSIPQIYV